MPVPGFWARVGVFGGRQRSGSDRVSVLFWTDGKCCPHLLQGSWKEIQPIRKPGSPEPPEPGNSEKATGLHWL